MRKQFLGKIIAGALTATTILGTAPTALTAYAEEAPGGYTTDSHEIMAYKVMSDEIVYDIMGYVDGSWRQVTYSYYGIFPVVFDTVNNSKISSGIEFEVIPTIVSDGRSLVITYTLKNTSEAPQSLVFGLAADTMVNGADKSVNIANASHTILEMTYDGVSFDAYSSDAGFKIYPTEYSGSGVTYSQVKNGADPRTVKEVTDKCDSAFVAYWPDTTLAPGQASTYTFITSIAAEGSGLLGGAAKKGDINTVNIGEFVLDNWEDILEYMPELVKQNLVAVNERNADLFHVDISSAGNMYVPESVVAALANADTTGLHVFIGEGDAVTFKKGYDYSAYKTMNFNHTDSKTENSRTIKFEKYQPIGGTVVLHTGIGVPNTAVCVYEVSGGQEVEIAKTVSNAEGLVCFNITETSTYVVRY